MRGNGNIFGKVTILVLVLSQILNIYGFQSWSCYSLYSLIFSIFYCIGILLKKNRINLPRVLTLYFVYWALSSFISTLSVSSVLSPIQIWLGFVLFWGTFEYGTFYKYYKVVGVVSLVFFAIQFIAYNITGQKISSFIPGLPIADENIRYALQTGKEAYYVRFSSFFAEPAHFAQFLLPLLAIFLLYDKKINNYVFAVAIIVVLLLLQSGNALIGLVPIIGVFVLNLLKPKKNQITRYLILSLIFVPVIYIGVRYYLQSEMGEVVMRRSTEVTDIGDDGSAYLRLVRGIFVFENFSLTEKIFGCPNNELLLSHVRLSGQIQGIDTELYFNGIQTLLLKSGIVGLIFFVVLFYQLWKGNNACGRAVLLSLVFLLCVASIFLTNTMLIYLLVSFAMKQTNQINSEV